MEKKIYLSRLGDFVLDYGRNPFNKNEILIKIKKGLKVILSARLTSYEDIREDDVESFANQFAKRVLSQRNNSPEWILLFLINSEQEKDGRKFQHFEGKSEHFDYGVKIKARKNHFEFV